MATTFSFFFGTIIVTMETILVMLVLQPYDDCAERPISPASQDSVHCPLSFLMNAIHSDDCDECGLAMLGVV